MCIQLYLKLHSPDFSQQLQDIVLQITSSGASVNHFSCRHFMHVGKGRQWHSLSSLVFNGKDLYLPVRPTHIMLSARGTKTIRLQRRKSGLDFSIKGGKEHGIGVVISWIKEGGAGML